MDTMDIFNNFVNAINEHDVNKMSPLMHDGHVFFDEWGRKTHGKNKVKNGWEGYFKLFPDYKIRITDTYRGGYKIAAFGFASGTFENKKTETNENYWKIPAAWQVEIVNDKIKLWQVCADSKIPFDIIYKETGNKPEF
jgi:ketosteroid isomerase-like protein